MEDEGEYACFVWVRSRCGVATRQSRERASWDLTAHWIKMVLEFKWYWMVLDTDAGTCTDTDTGAGTGTGTETVTDTMSKNKPGFAPSDSWSIVRLQGLFGSF